MFFRVSGNAIAFPTVDAEGKRNFRKTDDLHSAWLVLMVKPMTLTAKQRSIRNTEEVAANKARKEKEKQAAAKKRAEQAAERKRKKEAEEAAKAARKAEENGDE